MILQLCVVSGTAQGHNQCISTDARQPRLRREQQIVGARTHGSQPALWARRHAHISRAPRPRAAKHTRPTHRDARCAVEGVSVPHEPKLRSRSSFNDHSTPRLMGARARSHTGFAHTSTARESLDRSSIPRVRYAQQRDVARARLSGPRTTQPATRSRGGRISATR